MRPSVLPMPLLAARLTPPGRDRRAAPPQRPGRRSNHRSNRRRTLGLAVLVTALLTLGPACSERDKPLRIVLVTLDTLRHDAFHGRMGQPSAMPRSAAFAARGQVFEHFYAATPTTQPSHATLFTGLHPWQHGVQRNGALLADALQTVPEQLAAAGFDTAAVVASYPLHASFGFAQGFASYDDDFDVPVPYSHWEGKPLRNGGFYSLADTITDKALAVLDQLKGERQFLWVHYYDAHEPYGDTERGVESVLLSNVLQACRIKDPEASAMVAEAHERYTTDVSFLDRSLGRLFARLDADAEHWRTHVIVTADHGESFGEDGSLGHGKRLTEEQLLVPTFLVSPELSARRRADVAGTIDLAATLLSFAGLSDLAQGGRDLTNAPAAGPPSSAFGMRRTFLTPFIDFRTDGTMVRESGPRFFAVVEGMLYTGTAGDLYEEDLSERPVDDARSARLDALFATFAAELAGTGMTETSDPEALRALEALGYLR